MTLLEVSHILGNRCADTAAGAVCEGTSSPFAASLEQRQQDTQQWRDNLLQIYRLILDLQHARIMIEQQHDGHEELLTYHRSCETLPVGAANRNSTVCFRSWTGATAVFSLGGAFCFAYGVLDCGDHLAS